MNNSPNIHSECTPNGRYSLDSFSGLLCSQRNLEGASEQECCQAVGQLLLGASVLAGGAHSPISSKGLCPRNEVNHVGH